MSDNVNDNNSPPSERGFSLFISTLALIIAMGALLGVAFKMDSNSSNAATVMRNGQPMMNGVQSGTENGTGTSTEQVKLVIKTDEEHGKKGPEGSWHDAFLPANFSVKAGATVEVVVLNYDEGLHSFTSSELGTNVTIAAGSESKPVETRFTFHAPQQAGSYEWLCALPCDPWAMNTKGYMRGDVTVT